MTQATTLSSESPSTPSPDSSKNFNFESGPLAAKIKEVQAKVKGEELTEEAVEAQAEAEKEDSPIMGKDVDWNDYELQKGYEHLYPRARLVNTEKGPKWIVTVLEFYSTSRSWQSEGLDKKGRPRDLGEFMGYMVNGPEQWKPITMLPDGTSSVGVLYQRSVDVMLPDPMTVQTKTKVENPTEDELKEMEAKSLAWANEGTNGEPEVDDKAGEEESAS